MPPTHKRMTLLVLLLVMTLVSGGCAKTSATPSEGLTEALTALQERNHQKAGTLTGHHPAFDTAAFTDAFRDDFSPANQTAANLAADTLQEKITSFTYTLGAETVEEDRAKVQIDITYYDMARVFNDTVNDAAQEFAHAATTDERTLEAALLAHLLNNLQNTNGTMNDTFTVVMIRDGETWRIDPDKNDALLNVLTGNLSYY